MDIYTWVMLGLCIILGGLLVSYNGKKHQIKKLSSLCQGLDIGFQERKYVWQAVALKGQMQDLPVKIYFAYQQTSRTYKCVTRVKLTKRVWDLRIHRATKISLQRSDFQTSDDIVNKHFLLKSRQTKKARRFLKDPQVMTTLKQLVSNFRLGDKIIFRGKYIYYYTDTNVSAQKKARFSNTIQILLSWSQQLNKGI
ncbi:MAG TPA: hypothetical protein DCS93_26965 [Microscillaceae bacterium]|nr:hypothetical protein [Microscillaceae bacterium]